jgi:hypothetical protein
MNDGDQETAMTQGHVIRLVILAIGLGAAGGAAQAADPLGLYIGAAIGQADVRADQAAFDDALAFDEHHSAWKALVGLRPISLLGVELDYTDFGHPDAALGPRNGTEGLGVQADAHPRATTLFGVVYAPIPLPFLDVYGKAGLARLQTTVNTSLYCTAMCPPPGAAVFVTPFSVSETDTRFAYGIGAQIKIAAFAVRLEYERISAPGGDPDLVALGATWSF